MSSDRMLRAALGYARAGIPVFPCRPLGKEPACEHGHHDATTDESQIKLWWQSNPDFNIGIDPHPRGWCVIDEEFDAGKWMNGHSLPETYTVTTPRGGRHYYFKGSLRNSTGTLAPRVDTRGNGDGYVLAPPSYVVDEKKKIDGPYRVEHRRPVVALPAWPGEKLGSKAKAKKKEAATTEQDTPVNIGRAKSHLHMLPTVQQGQGANDATYKMFCELRGMHISKEMAVQLALTEYDCQPQDDRFEPFLRRVADNAFQYAQDAPGVKAVMPGSEVFKNVTVKLPYTTGDQMQERTTHWAWWPYLPGGAITILGGRGGVGKGLISSDLAARITTGNLWPANPTERAPMGRVLWCEAEDSPEETLKPRWIAAGADVSKIDFVRASDFGALNLATHIRERQIKLVVLSPLMSFLPSLTDSNAGLLVRAALTQIQDAIEGTECVVLGICHLNKKSDLDAVDKLLGSVEFANFVRSVVMVKREDEEDAQSRLFHAKFNLGPKGDDLTYTPEVVGHKRSQRIKVTWGVPAANIDTASAYDRKPKGKSNPATDEAKAWLKAYLESRPNRAEHSVAVFEGGRSNGHSEYAVKQAAKQLGVKSTKQGLAHGWVMRLPEEK